MIRQGVAKNWKDANQALARFHEVRPMLQQLDTAVKRRLETRGYVKTVVGRRLYPEPRKALNSVIQGGGSDIIKVAMLKVHKDLNLNVFNSHMILSIHDEIALDCTEAEAPVIAERLPLLMSYEPVSAVIPLAIDIEYTRTNWAGTAPWPPQ